MNSNNNSLSCFAAQEKCARRHKEEIDDTFRSCFSRDRDRILYSKEFRRLSGKTQVFVTGFDDHCRTRLTHTIEVAQIATTISKCLELNVDLTEAIAYGHDVGHTPFGHVGERFLNLLMNGCYNIRNFNINLPLNERGFKHNWQGLRVVSTLEKYKRSFNGINLTNYTRWGIVNHTYTKCKKCAFLVKNDSIGNLFECGYMNKSIDCHCKGELSLDFYKQYGDQITDKDWTYEAFVVAIADEIAQRHHDIEDGIEANIIKKDNLIEKIEEIFEGQLSSIENLIDEIKAENNKQYYIHLFSKLIVNLLCTDVIEYSKNQLNKLKEEKGINSYNDFSDIKDQLKIKDEKLRISFSNEIEKCDRRLQNYLFGIIINSNLAQKMDGKSDFILRQIVKAYITNPQQLPDTTIYTIFSNLNDRIKNSTKKTEIIKKLKSVDINEHDLYEKEPGLLRVTLNKLHKLKLNEYHYSLLRTICDYIAGMTDQYAKDQYETLY